MNRYLEEAALVVCKPDKRQWTRKLVIKLKTGRKCMDCQVEFPHYMLDYDHRPGETKLGNIELIAREGNLAKLLTEIDKCDLVCANCHRHRTYLRVAGVDRPVKSV